MKLSDNNFVERFDRLSLRERALMIVTIIVICSAIWNLTFLSYAKEKRKLSMQQIEQWRNQSNAVNVQINSLLASVNSKGIANAQTNLVNLKHQIEQSQEQTKQTVFRFVRPREMAAVLKDIIKNESGLKLRRLRSHSVVSLLASDENNKNAMPESDMRLAKVKALLAHYKRLAGSLDKNESSNYANSNRTTNGIQILQNQDVQRQHENRVIPLNDNEPEIYRHGLEIQFLGNFVGVIRYLQAIESLPWNLFWDEVEYKVIKHPQALVTVRIHTLSLDREWIDV